MHREFVNHPIPIWRKTYRPGFTDICVNSLWITRATIHRHAIGQFGQNSRLRILFFGTNENRDVKF